MLGGRIILLFLFHISFSHSRQFSSTYIKDEGFSVIPKHLVLQIIEQASENQCLHRCRRKELCKTIAYNCKARMCRLLKEAPERQEDTDNGGSVNQEQLVFQFDNQGMVSTNRIHDNFPLDSFPHDNFPRDSFPLDEFPLDSFSLDDFPLDNFPPDSFPKDSFPLRQFPTRHFPTRQFPTRHFPIATVSHYDNFPRRHFPTI